MWMRMKEKGNKAAGRTGPDDGIGGEWSKINVRTHEFTQYGFKRQHGNVDFTSQGGLRQLSVGTTQVWGVKGDGGVSVRMGISGDSPAGQEWVTVDGDPMRCVRH